VLSLRANLSSRKCNTAQTKNYYNHASTLIKCLAKSETFSTESAPDAEPPDPRPGPNNLVEYLFSFAGVHSQLYYITQNARLPPLR
jgi:hypothetical protein